MKNSKFNFDLAQNRANNHVLLDGGYCKEEAENVLDVATASIEELSSIIVCDMIEVVRQDLASIQDDSKE